MGAAAIAFGHLFGGTARAYRTAADLPEFPAAAIVRWKSDSPALELYRDGAPGSSFDATKTIVDRALRTWAAPACTGLTFAVTTRSAT